MPTGDRFLHSCLLQVRGALTRDVLPAVQQHGVQWAVVRMQEEVAEGAIRGSTNIASYQFMDDRYGALGVPSSPEPNCPPSALALSRQPACSARRHRC